MNFKQLRSDLKELEQVIIEAGGEDEEGKLEALSNLVSTKAEGVAAVLDGGLIEQEIKVADDAIAQINAYKKELERKKEYLLYNLHAYVSEHGVMEIDIGGTKKYVSPKLNVNRTVDTSLTNPYLEGTYTIKLSANDYTKLENQIWEHKDLVEAIKDAKYTCGVTQLPKEHKAIIAKYTPTVKITKTLPSSK